ncbi:MAG: TraC family protein [Rickettsiales bacterium]|nr:TraC family protein [Rickettsiales bacterium]
MLFEDAKRYVSQTFDDLNTCYGFRIPSVKDLEKNIPAEYNLFEYLHYDKYLEEEKIFENKNTIGFILRVQSISGVGSSIESSITQLISYDIPCDCVVQVINFASPYIGHLVDYWASSGVDGGILGDLVLKRAEFYKQKALQIDTEEVWNLRDFEIYYCFSLPKSQKQKLNNVRNKVKRTIKNMSCGVLDVGLTEFTSLWFKIFAPNSDPLLEFTTNKVTNALISDCVLTQAGQCNISESRGKRFKYLIFEVTEYPESRSIEDSINYVGDFHTGRGLPFPFWLSFGFSLDSIEASKRKANAKRFTKVSTADSRSFTLFPGAAEELEEWDDASREVKKGKRLSKLALFVVARIDDSVDIEDAKQTVKDHFFKDGFELNFVVNDTANTIFKTIPFGMGENWKNVCGQQGIAQTKLSNACVNLLPIFADDQNYRDSLMTLMGRRGQISFWDCFDDQGIRPMGGYGVSMIGLTGTGKSVLMNEYIVCTLRKKGKVVVVDDGRSFKNSCLLLGGDFIDFADKSFCLNPFSLYKVKKTDENIAEYRANFEEPLIRLILSIVCMILNIDVNDKSSPEIGEYRSILTQAINSVLSEKGDQGGFKDIRDALLYDKNIRTYQNQDKTERMAFMLKEYSVGRYAEIFNGKSDLKITSFLTVFELSPLESNPILRNSALLMVMFLTHALSLQRKDRTSLLIDECRKLLSHDGMSVPIEDYATKSRKNRANLVAASQNLTDFSEKKSLTAATVFANSDWKILFSVEGRDRKMLEDLGLDQRGIRQAYNLRGIRGKYSEFMIIHKTGAWGIYRLVLDSFSAKLYSSTGEEVQKVNALKAQGYDLKEAIEKIIKDEEGFNV